MKKTNERMKEWKKERINEWKKRKRKVNGYRNFKIRTSINKHIKEYRVTDKSLARPGMKQATSMSKSSWIMDPSSSGEMPSCSTIDLAEIRRYSKLSSWIWSIISRVVRLRTYQHPVKHSEFESSELVQSARLLFIGAVLICG